MEPTIANVAAAFERQDYRAASRLLKQLHRSSPKDPWVRLYVGRLYEVSDRVEAAEKLYRQLLRNTTIPKLLAQARQGLQRLENLEKQRREEAIAQAQTDPRNAELSVLILEAIDRDRRGELAKSFGRIMQLDPYTARLQLPGRGWRLYRIGSFGELGVYGRELRDAEIPVFWVSLERVKQIRVFRIDTFEKMTPQAEVLCRDERDRAGKLTFKWSEVTQRVKGLLPIFADVVQYNPHISNKSKQIQRKTERQDFIQVYDLHLPERNCILRLCDCSYQFQQGIDFTPDSPDAGLKAGTIRLKWNHLLDRIEQCIRDAPVWLEFAPFGETTVEYPETLSRIPAYIDVARPQPTPWDPAFHLYSSLVFLRE
jgi:tetratricopeptide (TPR) repeat protein